MSFIYPFILIIILHFSHQIFICLLLLLLFLLILIFRQIFKHTPDETQSSSDNTVEYHSPVSTSPVLHDLGSEHTESPSVSDIATSVSDIVTRKSSRPHKPPFVCLSLQYCYYSI